MKGFFRGRTNARHGRRNAARGSTESRAGRVSTPAYEDAADANGGWTAGIEGTRCGTTQEPTMVPGVDDPLTNIEALTQEVKRRLDHMQEMLKEDMKEPG